MRRQIGQERTPQGYVEALVDCLREWRRVLRPTGSVFLNVGDTFHNRTLVGIPGRLEAAAIDDGWTVRGQRCAFRTVSSGGTESMKINPARFSN